MTMNDPTQNAIENPWKDRASLPKPRRESIPLAFVILLISALGIPLCNIEWVSLGILAILFAYTVYAVRMPRAVTGILLIAMLPTPLTASFTISAIALSIVIGTSVAAYLFTVLDRPYLALLPFIAAFGIAYAVTGGIYVACLSLVFLPAGLLLALATLWGRRRTSAICMALIGLLAVLAAIVALGLSQVSKELGMTVPEYFTWLREQILEALLVLRDEAMALMGEQATAEQQEAFSVLMNDALFVDLVASLFNLIPGILVLLCSILAFASQSFLNHHYRAVGMGAVVTEEARTFTMSIPAAVLFIVAFFINAFATGNSFFVAVVGNLYLMLLPGFCLMGLISLSRLLRQLRGAGRFFFLLFLFGIACCSFGYVISFTAFWGAYQCMMDAIRKKVEQKIQPPPADSGGSGEE